MNNKSEKQDLKKKVDIHQLENGFGIFLRTREFDSLNDTKVL